MWINLFSDFPLKCIHYIGTAIYESNNHNSLDTIPYYDPKLYPYYTWYIDSHTIKRSNKLDCQSVAVKIWRITLCFEQKVKMMNVTFDSSDQILFYAWAAPCNLQCLPDMFNNYFTLNSNLHSYLSRKSVNVHLLHWCKKI